MMAKAPVSKTPLMTLKHCVYILARPSVCQLALSPLQIVRDGVAAHTGRQEPRARPRSPRAGHHDAKPIKLQQHLAADSGAGHTNEPAGAANSAGPLASCQFSWPLAFTRLVQLADPATSSHPHASPRPTPTILSPPRPTPTTSPCPMGQTAASTTRRLLPATKHRSGRGRRLNLKSP